jgi:hypothetical protein
MHGLIFKTIALSSSLLFTSMSFATGKSDKSIFMSNPKRGCMMCHRSESISQNEVNNKISLQTKKKAYKAAA